MKHYKGADGQVYAYPEDGSQDHFIPDTHVLVNNTDVNTLVTLAQDAEFEKLDYYRKRLYSYPELGEFVDAWVKNDQVALEEYRQKCLAVKAQFPKPTGF